MRTLYIILLSLIGLVAKAQVFPYRYLSPIIISPSEGVNCMYFDKEGLMWVGTDAGVKSYDGYQVKTFKANAYSTGILPNNTIRSITEDNEDNLWFGTRNGLVRMNKRTGKFKTFFLPRENQRLIYTLFTSKAGTLWIGTDGGLSVYNPKNESFVTYNGTNSCLVNEFGVKERMSGYSVKSIVEDKNGDLLIGTWAAGLLRFKVKEHKFLRYPKLNAMNSAYSLFFDKYHRLWVGTWGHGVMRIDNPDQVRNPHIVHYPYSASYFDTYYKMVEDPITHLLWACTREGVCFLDEDNPHSEWKYYNKIGNNSLNFNNDIATDGAGNIWLCTQNLGIIQVNTVPSPFKQWSLDTSKSNFVVNYVSSIATSDGVCFWLGLNPYGIAFYNRKTGATWYNQAILGFSSIPSKVFTASISSIMQRANGDLWFANNSFGIIVKPKGNQAHVLDHTKAKFIKEDYVNTLFEAKDKTIWIGQRNGLSIVYPNNKGVILSMRQGNSDFSTCDIRGISQDQAGDIWLATDNEGIIRVSGNPKKVESLRYKQYNPSHHNFALDDAISCLEDKRGRLWAISNSGGLFLYNREKDAFEPKNQEYHLPGDRVLAIQEDKFGNLWLTTDDALIHIVWSGNEMEPKNITYFTKEDGLDDILFSANTTCKYGDELFLGSRTSFFSFVPTPTIGLNRKRVNQLVVTDIQIDDAPFALLDSVSRNEISDEMPSYTHSLRIPSHVKKFSVEFSLLTYGNALKNIYAYRLDGYDDAWQYINGETRKAVFQNLPSGTYELHVKATDNYGHWQDLPYVLKIKVLPPWYASRWAFIVYLLLFVGGIYGVARWYKMHLKTRNRLQMGVILTNITHELLTPLTVISATIYKLKNMAPQYDEEYWVINSNINRTTRLLRQILEVRKSQAGQLRLLVSRRNLSQFVSQACEGIRPMASRHELNLETQIPRGENLVWFDADKLDKILYNLLSNAIKYNKSGGKVVVSLKYENGCAIISIRDNGIGMSKEKQKHLYTPFFDGDYRKQNMTGTGIGLALTHDLVTLHHGEISCETMEGQGTTFTVRIPIRKSAYSDKEIDLSNVSKAVDAQSVRMVSSDEKLYEQKNTVLRPVFVPKNAKKLLVVEDNEELLTLMYQMLSKSYQVFTAKNGKQALNIVMKEELDLVVSDVMMPIMDGIELTQRIKEDKNYWQLPVILLTAKNKEADENEGYAIGADAYITKPFKFEELEVRINTLIDNRQKIQTTFQKKAEGQQPTDQTEEKHFSNPDKVFVDKATEMVMQHLADSEYDRDSFAKDMAVGGSTLYNKVKTITGQTVIGFITSIRMNEAKRMMESDPNILINDLSVRVGFNTPKYFSKCFKKEFGMFPKEYAEQLKSKRK